MIFFIIFGIGLLVSAAAGYLASSTRRMQVAFAGALCFVALCLVVLVSSMAAVDIRYRLAERTPAEVSQNPR